jgi:hypothetical protein
VPLVSLAASAPPTANPTASAVGKKIPVLVSPVVVIAGTDAVPAGNTIALFDADVITPFWSKVNDGIDDVLPTVVEVTLLAT